MANFHYRLLIIDDEPLSRELLQSSLSEQGYEVRIAKDGFAALAQLQGALPDLIVTDCPAMLGLRSRIEIPVVGILKDDPGDAITFTNSRSSLATSSTNFKNKTPSIFRPSRSWDGCTTHWKLAVIRGTSSNGF